MDAPVVIEINSTSLQVETIATALESGPGVVIIRGAYPNHKLLDSVTHTFYDLIEKADHQADHFTAGSNQRLWNAVGKLANVRPDLFAEYYGNPWLHLCCRAWLGPLYQITAQVNVVVPGGVGQTGHRDYHLGFFPESLAQEMPVAFHEFSQRLTLQGAIVHCDVPLQMGPTRFVLGSQIESDGYKTFRTNRQQRRFEKEACAVPLEKGDLVVFNPRIFHAAGTNETSDPRLVNLVQVSSAMAKPMESLDFESMISALYPFLQALDDQTLDAVCRVITDAYPFPTNLDTDPPSDNWLGELESTWLFNTVRSGVQSNLAIENYAERRQRRKA